MLSIGVDIGGSKIAAGIVGDDYKIVSKKSSPFPHTGNPMDSISTISSLIGGLLTENNLKAEQIAAIGLAVPGSIDYDTGVVIDAHNLDYHGFPLSKLVGEEFPGVTVYVENDANAAADQDSAANGSLGVIELASLPGFPPQRDLIADIDPMLNQIRKLTPYLQADGVLATTAEGKVDVFEYLQNPEQLAKYELLSNCIACGVCEGACPVYAGGDAFIGPAALIWASRFVNDSRDTKAMERMDAIDTADGVAACQSVRACSRHCPRGIDVGEEMWQIVAKVRER